MDQTFAHLEILLGAAALWILYWCAFREYALDRLRQRLFQVRGELFDSIAQKEVNLTFSSPEYVELRRFINRVIKYGYAISPLKVVLYKLTTLLPFGRGGLTYAELNACPPLRLDLLEAGEYQALIRTIKAKIYWEMAVYFLMTSPMFFMIIAAVILFGICRAGFSVSREFVVRTLAAKYFDSDFKGEVFAFDDSECLAR